MIHEHEKYEIHVITSTGVNTRPLKPHQLETLINQGFLHLVDSECRVITKDYLQSLETTKGSTAKERHTIAKKLKTLKTKPKK